MEKENRDLSPKSAHSEERFILAKGLNDILIALGIGFLSLGILVQIFLGAAAFLKGESLAAKSLFWPTALCSGFGLLCWVLSEYLTGYRKLVLPSIVLTLSITVFSYVLMILLFEAGFNNEIFIWGRRPILGNGEQFSGSLKLEIMTVVGFPVALLLLYYWRFKLPFALLMVAVTAIFAANVFRVLFPEWSPVKTETGLFLLAGCATFLWAMGCDLKDPVRQTRFADCAFWLHLLAAPLIVGSLTAMLIPNLSFLSSSQAALLFSIIFALGVVSLIIDRRSLLMAGLFYLGTSIAYAARVLMGHSGLNPSVFSITLMILGAFVVFLGVGWVPIRRILVRTCIPTWMARRLRPVDSEDSSKESS